MTGEVPLVVYKPPLRNRARGIGMTISRTGIRPLRSPFGAETPWSEVKRMTLDSIGLRLEGELLERPYRLSRRAPNYLVLAALVPELASLETRPNAA